MNNRTPSWLNRHRGFLPALTLLLSLSWISGHAQAPSQSAIFRLVTFQTTGDLRLGATQGNGDAQIVDIHNAILALKAAAAPEVNNLGYVPADMKSLIEVGDSAVAAVKTAYRAALALKASGKLVDPGGERRVFYPPTSVRLRTPIPNPQKLFGMASNYASTQVPAGQDSTGRGAGGRGNAGAPAGRGQANTGGAANAAANMFARNVDPQLPSYFLKSPTSLIGPDDEIVMTDLLKNGLPNSHEPEFAFVIGKRARNVPEAQAMDYVFGYTIHNDVTGRTLASGTGTATEGSSMTKGMDTFGPVGPYLTLKEDVPDPHNLAIETKINGKVFQMANTNTKYLLHKIPQALSVLSYRMTLLPGDIISTGVPEPTAPLNAGDTIEITIERLGTLRNRVVAK